MQEIEILQAFMEIFPEFKDLPIGHRLRKLYGRLIKVNKIKKK